MGDSFDGKIYSSIVVNTDISDDDTSTVLAILGGTSMEAHVNFSSMRRVFYDPYGNSNNLDDLTFNIDLQYGRRATLTGWSNTRDYHLGFLTLSLIHI